MTRFKYSFKQRQLLKKRQDELSLKRRFKFACGLCPLASLEPKDIWREINSTNAFETRFPQEKHTASCDCIRHRKIRLIRNYLDGKISGNVRLNLFTKKDGDFNE